MKEKEIESGIKIERKEKPSELNGTLVPGKDFIYMSKNSRPILLKSGAEKILDRMKLRIESLNCVSSVTDRENEFLDFTYRCIIRDDSGIIAGISEGSSNSNEECYDSRFIQKDINQLTKEDYRKKLMNGDGKWFRKDGKWIWFEKDKCMNKLGMKNFVQKTAQKRAFVGAVLMASGLSDLFVQN